MWNWMVEKWDWWIYCRSYHSMRRMCKKNPGYAYLLELRIKEYRRQNPMPESLERATEEFHRALS